MPKTRALAAAFTLAIAASPAHAESALPRKPVLSLEAAERIVAAAEATARAAQAGGAIAVVDDGGHLLVLHRLDGTFAAAAPIAAEKARSAAVFRKATRDFEEAVKGGRVALVANRELLPMQGGVPILVDGAVVGAVGVAGAKSAQHDDEIAQSAARALDAPPAR